MEAIKLNKPVALLTVGEFLELVDERIAQKLPRFEEKENRNYVYGIKGLANLLGCSKANAQRIKSSGKIDEAISQSGRKIIIDSDKVLELLKA